LQKPQNTLSAARFAFDDNSKTKTHEFRAFFNDWRFILSKRGV